jgi:hypothetical protein
MGSFTALGDGCLALAPGAWTVMLLLGCVLIGVIGIFFGTVLTGCADLGAALTSLSKLERLVGVVVPLASLEGLGSAGLLSVFFGNSADFATGRSPSSDKRFFLSIKGNRLNKYVH